MIKSNPFKFGSIVDDPYFTNRKEEISRVSAILNSNNHLTIISPRRYGKSSLIFKVVKKLNRPVLSIDMQLITSTEDLATQLLKRIYRLFPFEKIRQYVKQFQIIPSIIVNPVNNDVNIEFQSSKSKLPILEDVLNLIEKLSNLRKKIIVIFDEFQEAGYININLFSQLRAIMQHHKKINYVFLGSQESLIRDIFEKQQSPFYHFSMILPLGKIPITAFESYLKKGFGQITENYHDNILEIIAFTKCHPYYTQQLAYEAWNMIAHYKTYNNVVESAINHLVQIHDIDYEHLWNALNKTDKKLLIGLSLSEYSPLTEKFNRKYNIGATSTAFSSIKRMMKSGYITRINSNYEIDDPFLSIWIKQRRER